MTRTEHLRAQARRLAFGLRPAGERACAGSAFDIGSRLSSWLAFAPAPDLDDVQRRSRRITVEGADRVRHRPSAMHIGATPVIYPRLRPDARQTVPDRDRIEDVTLWGAWMA